MKSLIAYYSRKGNNYVGNTEVAARTIQKLAGGDSFKIDTVEAYPAGCDETTRAAREELRRNARPELKGRVDGMEGKRHGGSELFDNFAFGV